MPKTLVYNVAPVAELAYHAQTHACICNPAVETEEFKRLDVMIYTIKHRPLTEDQMAGIEPRKLFHSAVAAYTKREVSKNDYNGKTKKD